MDNTSALYIPGTFFLVDKEHICRNPSTSCNRTTFSLKCDESDCVMDRQLRKSLPKCLGNTCIFLNMTFLWRFSVHLLELNSVRMATAYQVPLHFDQQCSQICRFLGNSLSIRFVVNEVLGQKRPTAKGELSRSRLKQILHQGHCMFVMHLVMLFCAIYQSGRQWVLLSLRFRLDLN